MRGPARQAGLREGDLLIALNGRSIATMDDLHRLLAGTPAGLGVTLTILRDRERRELTVVTGEV